MESPTRRDSVLNVHLSCNTVLVWFIGTLYMCSCCGIYVMYVRQEPAVLQGRISVVDNSVLSFLQELGNCWDGRPWPKADLK